jgi:hypothetical protein
MQEDQAEYNFGGNTHGQCFVGAPGFSLVLSKIRGLNKLSPCESIMDQDNLGIKIKSSIIMISK